MQDVQSGQSNPISNPDVLTAVSTDTQVTRTSKGCTGSGSPWLFRLLAAITIAPIPITVVRNGLMKWYPTRDAALTAIWANDVFSAHTPLYGLPTSLSKGNDLAYNYLGALHLYLLAVPMKVLGTSWGILVGVGAMNIAWAVLALWAIRRRVGYRGALVGCVFLASLIWGLGSQVLIDPTPVQTGPLLFFAFCVLAWSVADGDSKTLVPFVVAANYLFLLHPKFALVVPVICLFALGIPAWTLLRVRRHTPEQWAMMRTRCIPPVAVSLAFTVIVWLPAVIDQLTRPGGNLHAWTQSMLHNTSPAGRGVRDLFAVVSSTTITWPLWFRDSLENPNFYVKGSWLPWTTLAAGMLVVLGLASTVGFLAHRRRDRTTVIGLGVGALVWIAWLVSYWRLPGTTYNFHYLLSIWPTSAFIWLMIILGFIRGPRIRSLVASSRRQTLVGATAFAATAVFAVLSVPIANFHTATPQENIPLAHQLRSDIRARVQGTDPVLVTSTRYPSRKLLPVAILALEENGIEVRVPRGWDSTVYRSFRSIRTAPVPPSRELLLVNDPRGVPRDAKLVSSGGTPMHETVETYLKRRQRLVDWAETTPTLKVAESLAVDDDVRALLDHELARMQRSAQEKRRTIFDDPDAVQALRGFNDESLVDALGVPGITDQELQVWLQDQATVLDRGRYFAFVTIR